MEPVAQATDDDGLICAASVTQNRPKLNHARFLRLHRSVQQFEFLYPYHSSNPGAIGGPGAVSIMLSCLCRWRASS